MNKDESTGGLNPISTAQGSCGFGTKVVDTKNLTDTPAGFVGFGIKTDGQANGGLGGIGLPESESRNGVAETKSNAKDVVGGISGVDLRAQSKGNPENNSAISQGASSSNGQGIVNKKNPTISEQFDPADFTVSVAAGADGAVFRNGPEGKRVIKVFFAAESGARELQVVSQLSHSNIISLKGSGHCDQGFYIVYPFYKGGLTLPQFYKEGFKFPPERFNAQAASAVEHLWERDYVWVDGSPFNSLVRGSGAGAKLTILDFAGALHKSQWDDPAVVAKQTAGSHSFFWPPIQAYGASLLSDHYTLQVLCFYNRCCYENRSGDWQDHCTIWKRQALEYNVAAQVDDAPTQTWTQAWTQTIGSAIGGIGSAIGGIGSAIGGIGSAIVSAVGTAIDGAISGVSSLWAELPSFA